MGGRRSDPSQDCRVLISGTGSRDSGISGDEWMDGLWVVWWCGGVVVCV